MTHVKMEDKKKEIYSLRSKKYHPYCARKKEEI